MKFKPDEPDPRSSTEAETGKEGDEGGRGGRVTDRAQKAIWQITELGMQVAERLDISGTSQHKLQCLNGKVSDSLRGLGIGDLSLPYPLTYLASSEREQAQCPSLQDRQYAGGESEAETTEGKEW